MKKIIAVFILLVMMVFNISADDIRIRDDAGLLSQNERYSLEEKIDIFEKEYGIDFVIYTTSIYYSGDVRYDAADYYDYNDYSDEGVLLYINMANREYFVLTTGDDTIYRLTDYAIEKMNNRIGERLSNGDYYEAMSICIDYVADYLDFYNETLTPYDYNNTKTESERLTDSLMISGGIAIVVTAVALIMMISQLKSVKGERNASEYAARKNSFLKANITSSRDVFLYRTVTRTPRPKEPPHGGGGGSSTFSGSSGTSHGGGGGRF